MIPMRLKLRSWQRYALVGSLVVVAALALTRFVYLPLWGKILQARDAAFTLKTKTSDAESVVPRINEQRERLASLKRTVDDAHNQVGSGGNLARMLEQLSLCAERAGLEMSLSQEAAAPLAEASQAIGSESNLLQVPVTLRLRGRYHLLGAFFAEIETAPFFAQVKSLSFARQDAESPELAAEVVLELMLSEDPVAADAS